MSRKVFCDKCSKEIFGCNAGRTFITFKGKDWSVQIKGVKNGDSKPYDICTPCAVEMIADNVKKVEEN